MQKEFWELFPDSFSTKSKEHTWSALCIYHEPERCESIVVIYNCHYHNKTFQNGQFRGEHLKRYVFVIVIILLHIIYYSSEIVHAV